MDRFNNYDNEVRDLVLDFERTVMHGQPQFFDLDELEIIIDYYLEVDDLQALDKAVQHAEYLYPGNTQVRIRRAHQLISHKQYQPAIDILLSLRTQEPDNTDVAYSLGVAYSAVNESQKAISCYQEALNDGWMPGRVYANIAEEYYKLNDLTQSIAYYEAALSHDPADHVAIYNYYDTCIQADRIPQAIQTLQDILHSDPYNKYAWYALGILYQHSSLFEKALDALQFVIAIDPAFADAYIALSQTYDSQGDTPQAVSAMLRLLQHSDRHADIYRTIGNLYARNQNFDSAIPYFRKAIDADPAAPESFSALAVCYLYQNDLPSALASVRKALKLHDALPQSDENAIAEVLFAAALIFDSAGYFDKASECFERMLLAPDCLENHCQSYAQFLLHHKIYDILIEFGQESLALYPHDSFYSTYLAAAYFYTNRYNKARKVLPDTLYPLLAEICPEIITHPLLGPYIPTTLSSPDASLPF